MVTFVEGSGGQYNPLKFQRVKTTKLPWVEKYRPQVISDLVYQEEAVSLLRNVLETNELPNLLLYGPPGTGKTSAILALANQLFGRDKIKSRVLELNASDERGIQVIREKVKRFSQLAVPRETHSESGRPLPCYKIVILDEADSMTTSAQAALRRVMETEMVTTRFCIICNYISRIINPITSRCSKFFFRPIPFEDSFSRLSYVRSCEGVNISDETLSFLIVSSEGDLRKAIMNLQNCSLYFRSGGEVTRKDIEDLCGIPPMKLIEKLFSACEYLDFTRIQDICKKIFLQGYSIVKVISALGDRVLVSPQLSESSKSRVFMALSTSSKSLENGADGFLQLFSVSSTLVDEFRLA